MFDDLDKNQVLGNTQPVPSSTAPANVPQAEPQDIFANVDDLGGKPDSMMKPPIFQPKKDNGIPSPITEVKPTNQKKIMLAGIIVIIVALFFAGIWYGYYILLPKLSDKNSENVSTTGNENQQPANNTTDPASDSKNNQENPAPINSQVSNENPPAPPLTDPSSNNNQAGIPENAATSTDPSPTGTSSVPGIGNPSVDSDNDGLTDEEEKQLGTDPNSADSDNDGLFDREEAKVYKTNPLDQDTDKDTYLDGAEVKGGYNPNGAGKLYDLNK